MAKKQRKKSRTKPSQIIKAKELVALAGQQLQRGQSNWAVGSAERALKFARTPEETSAARKILAEGHLNLALETEELTQRLQHLDDALRFGADDPKLHFHRGLTLWRLQRPAEALAEFDRVAAAGSADNASKAQFPDLAYLHQLALFATGQPWQAEPLAPPEANTLQLLQALVEGKPATQLRVLLEQPMVGDVTLWQTLVAIQHDPAAVDLEMLARLAERTGGNKLFAGVLHYLRGIVAMRQNKSEVAKTAWASAQRAGWDSPGATQNLNYRLREDLIDLADQGQWSEIVRQASRYEAADDTIWMESVGLACFHLGWQAAQAGDWHTAARYWRMGNEHWGNRHLAQNLALAEESLENWPAAAEAWREMIRRRPRKENHPDYLSNDQVAALWEHAAGCYERVGIEDEATTCLQNAVKYRPDDVKLRLRLVETYMDQDRVEVAEKELQRILDLDPDNLDALMRLGVLYRDRWNRDARSVWKRILALDPDHADAKASLVMEYLNQAEHMLYFGLYTQALSILESGLKEVPGSPQILLMLGLIHREADHDDQARRYLLQAYEAAPQIAAVAGSVMHELLHLEDEEAVHSLLTEVRGIRGLQPAFWIDQAEKVLGCELDQAWAIRFFDEAIDLIEQPAVDDTKAGILLDIYEAVSEEEDEELIAHYRKRIQNEVPDSGAVEYIDGYDRHFDHGDSKGARRLMGKAKKRATSASDIGVLRRAEEIESLLSNALPNFFGDGPNPREFARMLDIVFGEEDEDEFPKFI